MRAKLYGFWISSPTISVRLMLDFKGIGYEFSKVMPGTQRLAMRAHGFGGGTVPGLKLDGRSILGSTRISRALEEDCSRDPASFRMIPSAGARSKRPSSGRTTCSRMPRRPYRWAMARSRPLRRDFAETMGMPLPGLSALLGGPVTSHYARLVSADEETVRRGLAELPGLLDHVDELIAEGTIGGEKPNAADFQIAPTVRLMLTFADLRPAIEGRPAAARASTGSRVSRRRAPVPAGRLARTLKAPSVPAE